jgi:3-hydroxyisobutyrate dehydrogenase
MSVPVTLLGLGAMGRAMQSRLDEGGADVRGWRRGQTSPTLADVVAHADVILIMVSDDVALLSVIDLAIVHARPGTLFVDMGTSGVAAAIDAAARTSRAGHRFLDVPVSGTVGPARQGALLGFAGGDVADLARAKPVLDLLCRRVIHAGAVGQGQALKVVLNGVGAHHLVAFASMLALGERAGLSRESIVDAFTDGAFASPSYVGKKPRVLERRYDAPEFSLRLTKKDIRLARDLAARTQATLPALDAIANEIERGIEAGLGEEDLFALEKAYPRR